MLRHPFFAQARIWRFAADAACGPRGEQGKSLPCSIFCCKTARGSDILMESVHIRSSSGIWAVTHIQKGCELMISTQVIAGCIEELRNITKVNLAVFGLDGSVVVSTFDSDDISRELITGFAESPADSQVIGRDHLLKIMDENELVYVLMARGNDDAYLIGKIAVSQMQQLITAYKERFDRNNFFQNLLMDNLLLVDVYNRAKKLHIDVMVPRVG